ncbi:diguanylate cyclase domain-containing protein [Vibrio neptunius]|uniref:diguanylate cyclase domain-containing protein n=1 Tax=Vibrio neptunius TaxID=170651 RepID=UPI0019D0E6C7|nr:diguanylate cyclase [Vibrio neptunius]MBN3574839.1 diguanylate cyclase [Vibrio neptunius]QXX08750.1 diguanylate cyclase [Vibrio neptunius]
MVKLKHFSLKQLTILVSISVVLLFLVFYFTFKALWSHELAVEASKKRQEFEIERVQTVLKMEELELRASLEDYAAWTTLTRYVQQPSDAFITDSIGPHAFESKLIDGMIIFDHQLDVKWSALYRDGQVHSTQFIELNDPAVVNKLLVQSINASSAKVSSHIKYAVHQNEPYMVASARICLSDGKSCDFGYIVFIRKIRNDFIAEIEAATGVDINIHPISEHDSLHGVLPDYVSIIYRTDFLNGNNIAIEIIHNEKLPTFLTFSEASVLACFSLVMFILNLSVVSKLIKPLEQAQKALRQFQKSGDKLPNEASFISKEMKSFARDITNLITELDEKRAILKKQSIVDPLTGIANRRHLYETARYFIEELSYSQIGIILVDIDHFKQYNDNYGHVAGDRALRLVAQALRDVESPYEHLVCRYGGEEFCVLLASDIELELDGYLSQLVSAIRHLSLEHAYSPTKPYITISAGATSKKTNTYDHLTSLFQYADQALYQVKQNGRNGYQIISAN